MTGYEQAIIEGSQTQSYISHMSSCLGFFTNGIPIELNSNFCNSVRKSSSMLKVLFHRCNSCWFENRNKEVIYQYFVTHWLRQV